MSMLLLWIPATPPKNQQWKADLYHLASCVCSGSYFWTPVLTQLNIDSNVYHRLRFEPETKCSESSWDERWRFVIWSPSTKKQNKNESPLKLKRLCLVFVTRFLVYAVCSQSSMENNVRIHILHVWRFPMPWREGGWREPWWTFQCFNSIVPRP